MRLLALMFLLLPCAAMAQGRFENGTGNQYVVPVGPNGSAAVPVTTSGTTTVAGAVTTKFAAGTPVAGLVHSIVTGLTAVTVFTANTIVNQAYITNPPSATEPLFVDPVTTAVVSAAGTSNGTSTELAPGQTYATGPLTTAVTVNATTAAHGFTAVRQ